MPILEYDDEDDMLDNIAHTLERCKPFPGDDIPVDQTYHLGDVRFIVERSMKDLVCVYDRV